MKAHFAIHGVLAAAAGVLAGAILVVAGGGATPTSSGPSWVTIASSEWVFVPTPGSSANQSIGTVVGNCFQFNGTFAPGSNASCLLGVSPSYPDGLTVVRNIQNASTSPPFRVSVLPLMEMGGPSVPHYVEVNIFMPSTPGTYHLTVTVLVSIYAGP